VKSWILIWIRIKDKIQELHGKGSKSSQEGPWTLTLEVRRLTMDAGRICRPVVADPHLFGEEQDPDPNPHQSGKLDRNKKRDPDPHQRDPDPRHLFHT
jgi:hypothetical protein